MSPDGPALLLTGATGFVGGALLKRLLAKQPDRRVVLLVRQPDQARRAGRAPGRLGSPRRPDAGQSRARPRRAPRLERSVTEVLHCAAVTQFGLPLETARAVNTEGTRQVLELARRCRSLAAKLAYVGAVYVAGRTSGRRRGSGASLRRRLLQHLSAIQTRSGSARARRHGRCAGGDLSPQLDCRGLPDRARAAVEPRAPAHAVVPAEYPAHHPRRSRGPRRPDCHRLGDPRARSSVRCALRRRRHCPDLRGARREPHRARADRSHGTRVRTSPARRARAADSRS